MKAGITGVGAWFPEHAVDNSAWPESFAAQARPQGDRTFNDIPLGSDRAAAVSARHIEREALDPFIGAVERRVAAPERTAVEAATLAAQAALDDAGVSADQVDAVLSYSQIPDRIAPAAACPIAARLGTRQGLALGLEAACATAIPQLATACALVDTGLAETILVTQSHLMLRAFPRLHPAAPGLGDGATAFVVGRSPRLRLLHSHNVTHGEYYEAVTFIRESGDQAEPPWYAAGGSTRLGSLDPPAAKQLMRDTVEFGARTVREVAEQAGIALERIAALVSVQPRGWIPGAIAEVLGLPSRTAVTTFERYAHIGACGPVANLREVIRTRPMESGDIVAMYAQGAGFIRSAALLEVV